MLQLEMQTFLLGLSGHCGRYGLVLDSIVLGWQYPKGFLFSGFPQGKFSSSEN